MHRIQSVDLIRLVAICGVIAIHTHPFYTGESAQSVFDPALVVDQISRFAVPFFFAMAGFFWAGKICDGAPVLSVTLASCWRIALIYAFWSAVYFLEKCATEAWGGASFFASVSNYTIYLLQRPVTTLAESTKAHLWFLPALMSCFIISAIFMRGKFERLLTLFAVMLFVLGLLGGAYSGSKFGFVKNFNFRNGPFFGLLFFVIGVILRKYNPTGRWLWIGLGVFAVGTCLQFAELHLIHMAWGAEYSQNFVAATVVTGLGAALIGLSNHPCLINRVSNATGPLVLGIYASHFLFVDLLKSHHRFTDFEAFDELFYIVAVLVLSASTAYVMSKNRITKRFVM